MCFFPRVAAPDTGEEGLLAEMSLGVLQTVIFRCPEHRFRKCRVREKESGLIMAVDSKPQSS
jgi:hypothetical protein